MRLLSIGKIKEICELICILGTRVYILDALKCLTIFFSEIRATLFQVKLMV